MAFALNEATGEPTLIQRIDTMGIEPHRRMLFGKGRMTQKHWHFEIVGSRSSLR